jgi:DNA-binding transcriptional LysR family regulator
MELYQLEYFLEAARQRNFTRAAARLHLAQAALSEQIRKLEDELGTALFHRGRRESSLTAAGEMLRTHAESLLAQADGARRAVQELVGLRRGHLAIGAIPSVSACLLPSVVAEFRRRYPAIELSLIEGTSETIAEWVESGRVQIGIVQRPAAAGDFDETLLLHERFLLFLPRSHAFAKRRSISLKTFSAEPFVFYKGRARDTALIACRAAGFEPRVACESGELETVRALVAAGLGVALLPALAARPPAGGCVTVRLSGVAVERTLVILTRQKQASAPAAAAFCSLLTGSNES